MEFSDVLEHYGIQHYTEGRNSRPGWIQLDCPWCGVEGKPGLGYKIAGGYCNCYKCGGHSAIAVLHELTKEPWDKLKEMLGGSGALLKFEQKRHTGKLKLPKGLGPLKKVHARFLKHRGFEPDAITSLWHIQALGPGASIRTGDDRLIDLSWRIFIPIIWQGELVSWTTRAIQDEHPKRYISAPLECETIPHKQILYGADFCNHAGCAIEGPLDVWRFGVGGLGFLGVSYTTSQIGLFASYLTRGIWLDNEPDAQRRARELLDAVSAFPGYTVNLVSETGKDASRSSDKEVRQARAAIGLSNV